MKHPRLITKPRLLVGIVVVSLAATATALSAHPFTDVPADRWFSAPVEWAYQNEITTGKTPTLFDGNAGVTRFEAVTFLKRYDDNIAQPTRAEIEALQAELDAMPTMYWAVVGPEGNLIASSHPAVAERIAEGAYSVTFDGVYPVEDGEFLCGFSATPVATLRSTGMFATPDGAVVTGFGDITDTLSDTAFSLTVIC